LVQGRGGAEFKTAGIHPYFEDFKRGANKDVGPKDNFETASSLFIYRAEKAFHMFLLGVFVPEYRMQAHVG
jgi:hypothetical protein